MVRKTGQRAPPPAPKLSALLDESQTSDDDDDFDPRGSSSQVASRNRNSSRNNTTRSSQQSPTRAQPPPRQQQSQAGNRNQAGSSRGRPPRQQPAQADNRNQAGSSGNQNTTKGAAKRKGVPNKANTRAPGNVLQQIRHLQLTTQNCIPKAPFCRVLKETLQGHGHFRMTKEAVDALQEASEMYLTGVFADAYRLTLHRSRVTIEPKDIHLLMYVRGGRDGVP